ncbi:MAG: helix-turn-helix transcriptional regulator [Chloroflexi bacterium]|nr:helix-turn-helix transcriptional regulator [Chloroflexota bacterium]
MTQEVFDREARFYSALAHPVRLQILDILTQGEACVCHLVAVLQQRQAYVSQQLAILKEAGLVADRKVGLYVYYHLADTDIVRVLREVRLRLATASGEESLLQIRLPARAELNCSCPECRAERSHL